MNEQLKEESPRWGSGIKLVISLTLAAIMIGLVIRFRNIIGPLLITFILAYLIYPLAYRLSRSLKLKWQATVTIFYLLLVLILIGLLTWGGVAIAQQIQSLISFVEKSLVALPEFLDSLSSQVIHIGTLQIDLSKYGLTEIGNQILNAIQPLLGQMGTIVGAIASGAAEVVGWLFFVLLVSYFILVESGGVPGKIINVNLPGFTADIRRMSVELGRYLECFPARSIPDHHHHHPCILPGTHDSRCEVCAGSGIAGGFCQVRTLCGAGDCVDNLWTGQLFSGHSSFRDQSISIYSHCGWNGLTHGRSP